MGNRISLKDQNFAPGLNSKASETGLSFGYFSTFENVRVNNKTLKRRKGFVRIHAEECGGQALYLTPSALTSQTSYVRVPLNTNVHQLPTRFTLDITVNPEAFTLGTGTCGYAYILGFESGPQPFSLFIMARDEGTGSTTYQFVFRLIDEDSQEWLLISADAFDLAPEDTVIPIRIVRDGSHMEMRIPTVVENTVQCSIDSLPANTPCIAPTDDLIIGSLDAFGSNAEDVYPFDGIVDEMRLFHSALPGHQHAFTEFPDARYPSLVAYYRFNDQNAGGTDASALIFDDSRYANHGEINGSASFLSPGLVLNLNPIEGIAHYRNSDGSRELIFGAGEVLKASRIL